ncbi:FAD binding domain-containing protein [Trichoderma velutinum]
MDMISENHCSAPYRETDFLIVGAGPAGSSMAAFLGQNGMQGLVISSAPGTSETPRAHLINPFGLECLRDIDLEEDARRLATTGPRFMAQRWCYSMVDIEFGRVGCWGGHPDTQRDLDRSSPCEFIDLPQTHLEPLLVKYATHHGFDVKFSNRLLQLEHKSDEEIVCTIHDMISDNTYQIKTRYVFGADGGRSTVSRALDFKFNVAPSFGVACNILINADLGHLMYGRYAQLHWIMKADKRSRFGIAPVLRMVKPWRQWLLVCFTPGTNEDPFDLTPESPDLTEAVKEMIGDDSVDIEVLRLDSWVVRETMAENYSVGRNVYLLGDAAHRHLPAYGLGSNTCIQDSYNLAWKVAYVSKGLAGPALLESYHEERQPVGANLVRESNAYMGAHAAVWEALGMFAPTAETGFLQKQELSAPTDTCTARRERLHQALEGKRREGESIGLAMNQWYESRAIYLEDEPNLRPAIDGDPVVKIQISTYPGTRLPHAWLDIATRRKPVSTQDLAGHGDEWKEAAQKISRKSGIPIKSYGIGFSLDYHDVNRDWHDRRGVQENGCVLVRPDRFVAWRSTSMVRDCHHKLAQVLSSILQLFDTKRIHVKIFDSTTRIQGDETLNVKVAATDTAGKDSAYDIRNLEGVRANIGHNLINQVINCAEF